MTEIFNKSFQLDRRRSLRQNSTFAERKLWSYLRMGQLDNVKFRRQFGVGPYVVDFYCPSAHLVIEVDGDSHGTEEALLNDEKRQREIEGLGIRFLRFTDQEVMESIEAVIDKISNYLARPPLAPPS